MEQIINIPTFLRNVTVVSRFSDIWSTVCVLVATLTGCDTRIHVTFSDLVVWVRDVYSLELVPGVIWGYMLIFQTWLFGYEMGDIVMVLCDKAVYFLASKKKIEFIKQVENNENDGPVPPLKFLLRDKVTNTFRLMVCLHCPHTDIEPDMKWVKKDCVGFFGRAVSTSGATYLVTMACVCLVVRMFVSHRGTSPPAPLEIIGSQKFQNQNVFQLILSNFSRGGGPPPVKEKFLTPDLA